MIPMLQTKRLTLRIPMATDWPAFRDFFASDRSAHAGGPKDSKAAWMHFAAELGHWQIHGFGMWTVTVCDDVAGLIGCWYPESWPEKEIGWLIWDGFEGKGYALEAATAVRAYCYNTLAWPTAVSYIHRDNTRSITLATRLGCTLDTSAAHPNKDALVYRHPAPQEIAA